jgi:hypothetical protein
MDISAFAEITYGVLKTTPLAEFVPTLCLPEKRKMIALEGVPPEQENDLRSLLIDWAQSKAGPEEVFLLVFRDGDRHFRIVRRFEGQFTDALYPQRKPS